MMFGKQGISNSQPVLMPAYTTQWIFFTIQDKSSLRVNLEAAAAKTGSYTIHDFFIVSTEDQRFCCVKIG